MLYYINLFLRKLNVITRKLLLLYLNIFIGILYSILFDMAKL
jgi:hypothetical protein